MKELVIFEFRIDQKGIALQREKETVWRLALPKDSTISFSFQLDA